MHTKNFITQSTLNQMVDTARKMVLGMGIRTTHQGLLYKASENKRLKVTNGRIQITPELYDETLNLIRNTGLPEKKDNKNYHNFLDSFYNPDDEEFKIRVNDRATYVSDYRNNTFHPLTRNDVIEGTKLIHLLGDTGIKGFSCGTPQDTPEILRGIEQYLISFWYNRNGGLTQVPLLPEIRHAYNAIREIAEDGFDSQKQSLSFWSPSPMMLDAGELDEIFEPGYTLENYLVGSMPIMGFTGPVDPIGSYTLSLAEVIGGAAVLHALFPEAKPYIMPHAQAADLGSGLLAFGSAEHIRLELIKYSIYRHLGLKYTNCKDVLTSSIMPDCAAQSEKMLNISSSLSLGVNSLSICPLSGDEGWSAVQCLMDIEMISNARFVYQAINQDSGYDDLYNLVNEITESGGIFADHENTLMNMFSFYRTDTLTQRNYSYSKWEAAGLPKYLEQVQEKTDALMNEYSFNHPEAKMAKIMDIYMPLCKNAGIEPIKF